MRALLSLVIAVAMLTAAWSSLGVIVLGLVHLVGGIGMLILPPATVVGLLRPLRDADHDLGYGAAFSWTTGVFLLTGVAFLVAAVAVAARRARASGSSRAVSAVLAIVLGLGAMPLVMLGADRTAEGSGIRTRPSTSPDSGCCSVRPWCSCSSRPPCGGRRSAYCCSGSS